MYHEPSAANICGHTDIRQAEQMMRTHRTCHPRNCTWKALAVLTLQSTTPDCTEESTDHPSTPEQQSPTGADDRFGPHAQGLLHTLDQLKNDMLRCIRPDNDDSDDHPPASGRRNSRSETAIDLPSPVVTH
ncbi:hypothetical protein NDR87_01445 [Nocardia sp. CDC159]|uniref:Uncharacterized protein n=1 Tax=Nocardia pulmonis TaxID=2951408 RepID=A0A9X2E2B5_9NOCA|nr:MULTISPECIES: hypothetical protein [Nocardia]MCM6772325.1 hypothetical protein [Nocardia pulmonis]MCM6785017.1 hypothetical protein [Nocardia sp. CDC159]